MANEQDGLAVPWNYISATRHFMRGEIFLAGGIHGRTRVALAVVLSFLMFLFPVSVSAASIPLKDPTLVKGWLKIDLPVIAGQRATTTGRVALVDESGSLWIIGTGTSSEGVGERDLLRFDGDSWNLMHSFPAPVTAIARYDGLYLAASGNVIYRSKDGAVWEKMIALQPPSDKAEVTIPGFLVASDKRIFISFSITQDGRKYGGLTSLPSQFGQPALEGGTADVSLPAPATSPGPKDFFYNGFEDSAGNVLFSVFFSEEGTANMGGRVVKIDKNGAAAKWDLCQLCTNPMLAKDPTNGRVLLASSYFNAIYDATDGSKIDTVPGKIISFSIGSDGSLWFGGSTGTIWQRMAPSTSDGGRWITRQAFAGGPPVTNLVTGPGNAVYAVVGYSSLYQFAGNKRTVVMTIGSKETATPDFLGEMQKGNMDVAPQVINGRTMVPVRFVAQGLGYEVSWVPETRTVVIKSPSATLNLPVGGSEAILESPQGKSAFALDVPAQVIDGRTMVPIRFVVQAFNAHVYWNGQLRQVIVIQ